MKLDIRLLLIYLKKKHKNGNFNLTSVVGMNVVYFDKNVCYR